MTGWESTDKHISDIGLGSIKLRSLYLQLSYIFFILIDIHMYMTKTFQNLL